MRPACGKEIPSSRLPVRAIVTRVPAVLVLGAIALASSGFLIGSSPDEEEFRFAIVSSWLHVRSLLRGDYAFWTSLLGLGLPQPLTPNFWLHPLLPLLPLVGSVLWVRILLLVHTLLGATGMWQLTKTLQLTPLTRAVCVVTFLLAAPVCNYVFTDFWPSHYVVWTSMPWVLVLVWRILDGDSSKAPQRSLALGLSAGLVVANTNPGHILVYVTLLLAVALTNARRLAARWPWIALSVLIAGAIASPNLAQLLHERRMFDPNLGVDTVRNPLTWSSLRTVFFSPWSLPESSPGRIDPAVARTLFFGGPFAALSVVGCLVFAKRRPDLVLTLVTAAFMLFTSVLWLPFASARFHFRDPLTLAAIPLAGLAADRLLSLPRLRAPVIAWLGLQVVVAALTAGSFLRGTWREDARQAMWFRGASGAREHVDQLLALMPAGGRVVYSPHIEYEVYEKARLQEGLGVNALAFRGVPLLNGWFKGVSTAPIWPDERMYYARINPPQSLIESDAALDALDIRYVVASDDETVASSLHRRGTVPKRDHGMFVVYENADAWPEAFLLDAGGERLELPVRSDCGNDRLLCRDFTPLASHRVAGVSTVKIEDGRIDVELVDAAEARLLVVSQMFREEWVATGDQRVNTMPAFGALLAVRVPPHVTSIHLRYRPMTLILATIAAWCALLGSGIGLLIGTWRSRFPVPGSKFR